MNKEQLRGLAAEKRAGVRRNAERLQREGMESQKAAAAQVLADLDAIQLEEHQQLTERLSGLEVAERVVEAFRVHPLTDTEVRLVEALMVNPGANSPQLSEALGWAGSGWHLHFGTMCRDRAEYLWPAPYAEKREADFYCGILCDTSWETGTLTYTLKPDVEAAFVTIGLRARSKAG